MLRDPIRTNRHTDPAASVPIAAARNLQRRMIRAIKAMGRKKNWLRDFKHARAYGGRSPRLPGVNISELSRRTGVSRNHLSRLVNGHGNVGLRVIERIADRLGVARDDVEVWLKAAAVGARVDAAWASGGEQEQDQTTNSNEQENRIA